MKETPQQYSQRVTGYLEGKAPMGVLSSTAGELQRAISGAPKKTLEAKPAPGGWSPAMILAHLADSEIVFGYRLRLVLGASGATIQGFDQDAWASAFDYERQDPSVSVEAFRVNREQTLRMLKKLSNEQWECYGMHTERGEETVRRIVELMAGHDINHLRQIRAIVGR